MATLPPRAQPPAAAPHRHLVAGPLRRRRRRRLIRRAGLARVHRRRAGGPGRGRRALVRASPAGTRPGAHPGRPGLAHHPARGGRRPADHRLAAARRWPRRGAMPQRAPTAGWSSWTSRPARLRRTGRRPPGSRSSGMLRSLDGAERAPRSPTSDPTCATATTCPHRPAAAAAVNRLFSGVPRRGVHHRASTKTPPPPSRTGPWSPAHWQGCACPRCAIPQPPCLSLPSTSPAAGPAGRAPPAARPLRSLGAASSGITGLSCLAAHDPGGSSGHAHLPGNAPVLSPCCWAPPPADRALLSPAGLISQTNGPHGSQF
jgi:hypothetical protein